MSFIVSWRTTSTLPAAHRCLVHAAKAMRSASCIAGCSAEIRNWIVAAGAAEGLRMQWHEYVPLYRTPAGTGCGMAFAEWR